VPSLGLMNRIAKAQKSIKKLRKIASLPYEEYIIDEDLQALTERYLHILLESILDLSSFIASELKIPSEQTYRGVIQALLNENIIPKDLATIALGIPGLRNILVHVYSEVRHDVIYSILVNELDDIVRMFEILAREATRLDP